MLWCFGGILDEETEQSGHIHALRPKDAKELKTKLCHALALSRSTGNPRIPVKCVWKPSIKISKELKRWLF